MKKIFQSSEGVTHTLILGDSMAIDYSNGAPNCFYDPQYDNYQVIKKPLRDFSRTFIFSDGRRIGSAFKVIIAQDLEVLHQLIWDCSSCWFISKKRPLQRHKLAMVCAPEFEKQVIFDWNGYFHGEPRKAKKATGLRGNGTFHYKERKEGVRASDLYKKPITKEHKGHGYSKPIGWIEYMIATMTEGAIYDPFAGKGTFMIAAANQRRSSVHVEINPSTYQAMVNNAIESDWVELCSQ